MLAALFFLVALFYASVGFGGGSSYLAILSLSGFEYSLIPVIALACNIVVVSGNSFHYVRQGHYAPKLLIPHIISSVPFAYLGGTLELEKYVFESLVAISLTLAGLFMVLQPGKYSSEDTPYQPLSIPFALFLGAVLGLLSGVIGIGGGIFLAPALYFLRAGAPHQIATTASLFILINSIAGIIAQLQKTNVIENLPEYWYLPLAVLVGGQIGNFMSIKILPLRMLAFITGGLVLLVGLRMGTKVLDVM